MIQTPFEMDLNKIFVQGDKLYAFGEDGTVSIYETPIMPEVVVSTRGSTESVLTTEDTIQEDEDAEKVVQDKSVTLELVHIVSVQTHSFLERGVADGAVSLDGSQIIAIGFDGTFTRIRLMYVKLK